MKKIVQIVPTSVDLYAVWEEDSDNGKRYGVDRAYYLGLDDNGDIYPLVIDTCGYVESSSYDNYMVFDLNGYHWWEAHEADLPVYEYFNRFEREQRDRDIELASNLFSGDEP